MAQQRYFQVFNCVEIDSSFYQLPKLETAERWRAAAPAEFQFALKAWQVITHRGTCPTYQHTRIDAHDRDQCGDFGYNATVRWAWQETFAIAKALHAALVLFQCPASFRPNKENIARLKTFFERAKRGRFQMGWEPRGEWPAELIAALCRELDLIHVVDPFQTPPATIGKVRYYRLHGLTGSRYRYTDADLHRLREMCSGRTPTFCMFNNIAMAKDATRLAALVSSPRQTPTLRTP